MRALLLIWIGIAFAAVTLASQSLSQIGFSPMMMSGRNCGSIFNGYYASRKMYLAGSVSEPSSCDYETQYSQCINGTQKPYSGSFSNQSCAAYRTRYNTSATTCPTPCYAETQVQSCSNGSCGGFNGSYAYSSCTQNPTSQSMNFWVSNPYTYSYNCNPYSCNPYNCNPYTCYVSCECMWWPIFGIQCQSCPTTCYNTCYGTCYDTCYGTAYSCDYGGTTSRSCSVSSNTVSGSWGGWSPNGSNYFSDSGCNARY